MLVSSRLKQALVALVRIILMTTTLIISELLTTHSRAISWLRTCIAEYLVSHPSLALSASSYPLDDYALLRFVLGTKSDDEAFANLSAMLQWRSERLGFFEKKREALFMPAMTCGYLGKELVMVSYLGKLDWRQCEKEFKTPEAIAENAAWYNEQIRKELDAKSRETGIIHKLISVIDLEGFSLLRINMTVAKGMGMSSAANEKYLSQLLGKVVVVNAPMTFRILFNMTAPFFSKKTLEKVSICKGTKLNERSVDGCPFVSKFRNGKESIPVGLGGARPIPPHVADQWGLTTGEPIKFSHVL